eukprot:7477578-Pyramimonas_sp.AAC.1
MHRRGRRRVRDRPTRGARKHRFLVSVQNATAGQRAPLDGRGRSILIWVGSSLYRCSRMYSGISARLLA